ncbi:MAG: group 1 glycosyl transferase [uncultured bacterium]|nr:MAG: group 1 glycosyl transferase [uncultured bacterium]
MKIAIHAADLDHERIDGTRVYIFNMLKNFGVLDERDSFYIYHRSKFNARLTPPAFANYFIKKISFPMLWTQLRFSFEIFRDRPDVLWMPMHNAPVFKRKNLKVAVTIHDLAFKIFPEYFPKKDLMKLNALCSHAVRSSDRIIAISEVTKNDILKFFPEVSSEKISVIHHGFDRELFEKEIPIAESESVLNIYNLAPESYLLYVGAIQPRKDLVTLIGAFEKVREKHAGLKLVLAGAPAWHAEGVLNAIEASPYKNDIVVTGTIAFDKLPALYQNATAFVFPSLYEGFGIPVLEAMASRTPTILADNSSLLEVGQEAALYFKTSDKNDLSEKILQIMTDKDFRKQLIEKGKAHSEKFSWVKCANATLDNLMKW